MEKLLEQTVTNELFHLNVNILNLEFKMGRRLSTEHPYYKKKIEIINDLSNRGLNAGDITDVERRAIEYIDRNSD